MRPWEFWRLTWFEWTVYMVDLYKRGEEKKKDVEFRIELTRQFMALFANANRGKNQRTFRPQDFWKLSYDKDEDEEVEPMTLKQIKEQLGTRIRRRDGDK